MDVAEASPFLFRRRPGLRLADQQFERCLVLAILANPCYSMVRFSAPLIPSPIALAKRGLIVAPSLRASQFEKEVIHMKKFRKLLLPAQGRRSGRRLINEPLLEKQREDVFVLMHQQIGGMR